MTATLSIEALQSALAEQHANVFSDGETTQYGVRISCPACSRPTQWVEGGNESFKMHPCGHEVTSLPPAVAVVAATLRVVAEQVRHVEDREELFMTAGRVEGAWDDTCCPLCEEVACDDSCPLHAVRAEQSSKA